MSRDLRSFHEAYKPIRNKLRKFDPQSILLESFGYLNHRSADRVQQLQKMPWAVLLCIKWTFTDEQVGHAGGPPITRKTFLEVLNQIVALTDVFGLPDQFDHFRLYLRALAFQQFWYQGHMRAHSVARQVLLFARQPAGHYFHRRFETLTGLGLEEFLTICLLFGADQRLAQQPMAYRADHFVNFLKAVPRERMQLFLDAVSVPMEELPTRLNVGRERKPQELWEESPFVDFPLVKIGDQYLCMYRELFQQGMGSFVFDWLKEDDNTAFNREFGEIFGNYVGDVLKTSGCPVVGESELRQRLGADSPVVDYLVADGDASILVEAKGVEAAASGRAVKDQDVLYGKLGTSVVRALEQAYGMHERVLALGPHAGGEVKPRTRNYLIVVTFKEMYLGTGYMLKHFIGEGRLESMRRNYPNADQLPIENMVFMCIDDFEYFLSAVRQGQVGIAEMLDRVRAADRDPTTSKFVFWQHLRSSVGELDPRSPSLASAEDFLYQSLGFV